MRYAVGKGLPNKQHPSHVLSRIGRVASPTRRRWRRRHRSPPCSTGPRAGIVGSARLRTPRSPRPSRVLGCRQGPWARRRRGAGAGRDALRGVGSRRRLRCAPAERTAAGARRSVSGARGSAARPRRISASGDQRQELLLAGRELRSQLAVEDSRRRIALEPAVLDREPTPRSRRVDRKSVVVIVRSRPPRGHAPGICVRGQRPKRRERRRFSRGRRSWAARTGAASLRRHRKPNEAPPRSAQP